MTTDEGLQFHFVGDNLRAAQASFCWPSTVLGRHYLSSGALMRTCLGLDLRTAAKPQPIKLHAAYELTDDARLLLADNSFLVPILNEAVPRLQRYFGDNLRIRLEVFSDPDGAAGDRELFARVLTDLAAREAAGLLDCFDEEWWFSASPRAKCLLNFGLRYV